MRACTSAQARRSPASGRHPNMAACNFAAPANSLALVRSEISTAAVGSMARRLVSFDRTSCTNISMLERACSGIKSSSFALRMRVAVTSDSSMPSVPSTSTAGSPMRVCSECSGALQSAARSCRECCTHFKLQHGRSPPNSAQASSPLLRAFLDKTVNMRYDDWKGKKAQGAEALRLTYEKAHAATSRSIKLVEPLLMYHWMLSPEQQGQVKQWASSLEIGAATTASSSSSSSSSGPAVAAKAKPASKAKAKKEQNAMAFFS